MERAPTIMVLEDLHWIDPASQEVLAEVLPDVLGLRMLVIAAHRPGWIAPWSEWGWPERLTLRPLSTEDASQLASAVLGGANLSPELERYVAERAAGNPFFLEEIMRALRDAGGIEERDGQMVLLSAAAERLPTTLTGVLLARLDRLDQRSRSVVQVASVIGRTFPLRLLAEVMGEDTHALEQPLTNLQHTEITFPRRSPDVEYVFKHVSMRDAAYNTMIQKASSGSASPDRQSNCRLYPADEYAEMIAHHYNLAEAPEAIEWLERAGDRAASIYAGDSAIADYSAARTGTTGTGAEPAMIARLDEKLGAVAHDAGRLR